MMNRTMRCGLWILGSLIVAGLSAGTAHAGDDPPEGPPWVRDYRAAQTQALAAKQPIFVYFTKTW